MRPFFMLIKCQLGKSYQVASALADAEIASEIFSIAGDHDLIVKFYVPESVESAISSTKRCMRSKVSRTRRR